MKHLFSVILGFCFCLAAWADNFIIQNGESLKLYCQRLPETHIERADRLFEQDYHEVFGEFLVHTNNMADAKIIVATYDNSELKKYSRIRGINFDNLAGRKGAFMLKVNNNGRQLFVVGSDELGTAFGLMTLSRKWGVSPFRWWVDAPALQMDSYELGVAYEELFEASVPIRTLIIDGSQQHDRFLQELLLRLRATGVSNSNDAVSSDSMDVFRWTLKPASMPYLGLSLALDAPERIRLEGLRAYDYGCRDEWQMKWEHQLGGELQLFLFFDMAWDIRPYRQTYSIDELEDLHYTQMSGLGCNWSQVWNDFFDLAMSFHPELPQSFEALRRGIGESQNLQLQLSLELNDKVVSNDYVNAYFRTIEYPINMVTSQIQRLCNMQLVEHDAAKPWAVDDCKHRMELLASELPTLVATKWRQLLGAVEMPTVTLDNSLMKVENDVLTPLQIGSTDPLPSEEASDLLYRSKRAIGTRVEPFEALRLPLVYQADEVHLKVSLLPVRGYGKPLNCMIAIDKGEPQLLRIDPDKLCEPQQIYNLVFKIDPAIDQHDIVLRTTSDAIYLQRIWLTEIK
jgi:hypothetical protein